MIVIWSQVAIRTERHAASNPEIPRLLESFRSHYVSQLGLELWVGPFVPERSKPQYQVSMNFFDGRDVRTPSWIPCIDSAELRIGYEMIMVADCRQQALFALLSVERCGD